MKNFFARLFGKRMDPMTILPPKVLEIILGELRGSDLLLLSLVSKKWYKFIGNSEVCMDKIKIHITEYFWSDKRIFKNVDVLRSIDGERQYKHLSIACIDHFSDKTTQFSTEHKLLMASFKWKSVILCSHSFENEIEFINFLGLMEPSIEEITLRTIKIKNFVGAAFPDFVFPHLKSLKLVNVSTFVYVVPFVNVKNLNEFAVATELALPYHKDHSEELHQRAQGIKDILLNNSGIIFLELFLQQNDFNSMFFDANFIANIKFTLEALMVGRFSKISKDKANFFPIRNFGTFLRLHLASLKEIYLPANLGDEVIEIIINEMQILKCLTMHNTDSENPKELSYAKTKLCLNENIETLEIMTRSLLLTDLVTTILPKLPNLKRLTTKIINQNVLDSIVASNHLVESIETDYFTAIASPHYHALQSLKKMIIYINNNYNFTEMLEAKEKLSNFEKVYLMSAKGLKRKWDLNNKSFTR